MKRENSLFSTLLASVVVMLGVASASACAYAAIVLASLGS
jgi:hypothetical protein